MPKLPDSGFDRVAPFYDQLSKLVYGSTLEQAQLAFLPHLPDKAKVLIIGGGSGWLLEQLISLRKSFQIHYLEASPSMLKLAEQRYLSHKSTHNCSVTFILGTEHALQPQEQFNVVITPFLLDLFRKKRLDQMMGTLYAALAPQGKWLFTDFWPVQQPPPLWQRVLLKSMYIFFGFLSDIEATELPMYEQHFKALGLQEAYSYTFYKGMVQSKVYFKA